MSGSTQIARTPLGQFQRGAPSPNPGGVPKKNCELVELAKQHTEAAITRLVELMQSKNEQIALQAISEVLNRGWGRSVQQMTASIDVQANAAQLKFVLDELSARGQGTFRRENFVVTEIEGEADDTTTAE